MSATVMTKFVRDLFAKSDDCSNLTLRVVRECYMKHLNVDSLPDEERSLLRDIVKITVEEMIQNGELELSEKTGDTGAQLVKVQNKTEQITKKRFKSKEDSSDESTEKPKGRKPAESGSDSEEESGPPRKKKKIENDSDSEHSVSGSDVKKKSKIDTSGEDSQDDSRNGTSEAREKKVSKAKSKKAKAGVEKASNKPVGSKGSFGKPAKKEKKISKQISESSDAESSSDEVKRKKQKVMKKKSTKVASSDDDSSDEEMQQQGNKKSNSAVEKSREKGQEKQNAKELDSDSDSLDEDDALSNIKKGKSKQTSTKESASDSESDDAMSKVKSSKKVKKSSSKDGGKSRSKGSKQPSKLPSHADDKDENVKKLEKIARTCGVLPVGKRYKMTFEDCRNNQERSEKLKQMLRDAGMTGKISMKSAEVLKLKREAAELLSSSNVIISEGRSRRSGNQPSTRAARDSSPLPKESFSRLKGIVDSEEESD